MTLSELSLEKVRWWRWRGHGLAWWVGITLGGLFGLCLAWLLVTGFVAFRATRAVDQGLADINRRIAAGDLQGASKVAEKLPDEIHTAHLATTGPIWWAAAKVPLLGEPAQVVRGLTASGDRLGQTAFPLVVSLSTDLSPEKLRVRPDTVNLEPLIRARPALERAAAEAAVARAQLRALPAHTYLGVLDQANARLSQRLDNISDILQNLSRAARIVPEMAGQNGLRRYFVGLQNEAEMRGTGGLPGSFAIAEFERGRVHFTHFLSDTALLPPETGQLIDTGLDFGDRFDELYGPAKPTEMFVNSNIHPDFPYAARIWAEMWERTRGERIHGAIAMDPTTLAYLLHAMGPVTMPGGVQLTAQNVVAETQNLAYLRFGSDQVGRKDYLVDILEAVETRLIQSPQTIPILNALAQSAGEGRLLVWSRNPAVESVLKETVLAGVMPGSDRPLAGLVINNMAGNKLDYYLHRSLHYVRSGCGTSRDVIVTITLENRAPANLPPEVAIRLDKPPYPTRNGDNRILVDYFATKGALVESVTMDDDPIPIAILNDGSRPVLRMDLEMPRGAPRTIVLHLTEPAGVGEPAIHRQPGVNPLTVSVANQSC